MFKIIFHLWKAYLSASSVEPHDIVVSPVAKVEFNKMVVDCTKSIRCHQIKKAVLFLHFQCQKENKSFQSIHWRFRAIWSYEPYLSFYPDISDEKIIIALHIIYVQIFEGMRWTVQITTKADRLGQTGIIFIKDHINVLPLAKIGWGFLLFFHKSQVY